MFYVPMFYVLIFYLPMFYVHIFHMPIVLYFYVPIHTSKNQCKAKKIRQKFSNENVELKKIEGDN